MILTLEVIGPQAAALAPAHRKVFSADGGTIGRLPDNDWVLPDPYVSSHHARIRHQDDTFSIEDTSTNGVFINENRLARNQPRPLASGDCIVIEPYQIRASITSESIDARHGADGDPFHVADPFGVPPAQAREPMMAPAGLLGDPMPGGVVDPLSLLGFEPAGRPAPHVPRAADLARSSVLADHYHAPAPVAPAPAPAAAPPVNDGAIPDDYDPLLSDSQFLLRSALAPKPPPVPAPAPGAALPPSASRRATPPRGAPAAAPAPAPAADDDAGLGAVLAHAGIEGVTATPALARSFGRILRIVVTGVMDVLQARQRIKEEFRMRTTTFKPKENNPLKFSANVDDALHNLLVKRNDAFFEPVKAFEDAFDDVRNHQMAMLAGVRAAFEAMLAQFDPDRLQEEFDRHPRKGALISMPAKLRYWEMYREKVHAMVKDADTNFRELFGDEFARAYEEQLERLKGRDRGHPR